MEILITQEQFESVCLNEKCINELTTLLNTVETKKFFRRPIDVALDRHKQYMPKNSEQYKKDKDILKRFFNFDDKRIDDVMSIKMMYDDDGNWMPINKLNTNYSDLAVLITDILIDEKYCVCKIVENLKTNKYSEVKEINNLSNQMFDRPEHYYQKYLKGNYDKYIQNNRLNTTKGDKSEEFVIDEMTKLGYNLIYRASEGSPIDTKLGVDMIFEKDGDIFKTQVKSVGSLSKLDQTPCDMVSSGIKEKGGYKVFKRNRITVNEQYVDYLVFTSGKKMLVLKKYQPVSIESIKPLKCVAKPINEFPKNNTFIDKESVVYSNF